MCENTVSRYVKRLEERGLIAAEPTKVTTKAGVTRNGSLRFTVLPPQDVIARHHERRCVPALEPRQSPCPPEPFWADLGRCRPGGERKARTKKEAG